jgi:nitroimidazol reductase NimA-like FMN-containing flavoprotein (pyridoxamine 5'-phosphate oxidase superfamily)
VRRRAGRGSHDRALIEAILDEGIVGHVGFSDDQRQPYVIPVVYARRGDEILLHGSPLSRMLGTLAGAAPVCLTVTLLDGLVLARSAFHHSVNYRSVVVLGEARPIAEDGAKRDALQAIVERLVPGRADDVRGPSDQELAATDVFSLPLLEASAKVRSGQPIDASEDYALPVWAGEIPLTLSAMAPIADERCDLSPPSYATHYQRGRHDSIAA